ncbi:hypothetical protein DFH28DRAFT_905484, partial [Melampsora americana]
ALKIYKTSILVFKDRDRYATGEFRFRSGYAKKNPRKMDALLPNLGHGSEELYWELMAMFRIMAQQCKLVHANLSEYNIL